MARTIRSEYDLPRQRLTAEERRKTILRAARAEFARVGYYGASTASIAREAGCSEPMLYKHFAGKFDLFMLALQDAIERVHHAVLEAGMTNGSVIDQTRLFLDGQLADGCYLELWRLRRHAACVDIDAVRDKIIELEQQTSDHIVQALERGVEQGAIRPSIDPAYVVACWTGLMHAACHNDTLEPGSFTRHARHAETFLQTLT